MLAGKKVSMPLTEPPGCIISRVVESPKTGKVTFTKHVAQILQKNCQECHRKGQIGPMPLVTYEDAKAWGEMIREVVLDKRMPPWYADPRYGKFSNDTSLEEKEIDTIVRWIDGGAPEGDSKDLPAAIEWVEGWRIGKPDVVFELPRAYSVPAEGVVPYKYFTVKTNPTLETSLTALPLGV